MGEHHLPPGVPRGGPEVGDDRAASARYGLSMLRQAGEEFVGGVRRALPGWARREAARLLDAWGRHGATEREELLARAEAAGEDAARRVAAELEELFALDPDEQRATPLQVMRSAHREVGAVLREAGVPPVERDEFAERAMPDDVYGLAPETPADLDDDLTPLHLAWGVAKATVHKARHADR